MWFFEFVMLKGRFHAPRGFMLSDDIPTSTNIYPHVLTFTDFYPHHLTSTYIYEHRAPSRRRRSAASCALRAILSMTIFISTAPRSILRCRGMASIGGAGRVPMARIGSSGSDPTFAFVKNGTKSSRDELFTSSFLLRLAPAV